jgi:hypothetical protein
MLEPTDASRTDQTGSFPDPGPAVCQILVRQEPTCERIYEASSMPTA